jgi:threonine dehydratase
MRLAFENLKLVLEPAGAASLSVVMTNRDQFKNKNVLIVSTGGNVDPAVFRQALDQDS